MKFNTSARVVTSPPYAMGLPYVDTDRLSLLVLGLADSGSLRPLEQLLTGNREIPKKTLTVLTESIASNAARFPDDVMSAILEIETIHSVPEAGFRRRAVAPLLYQYLSDMSEVFSVISANPTIASSVFVVGENSTNSMSGERIRIRTPELLASVAASSGLQVDEMIRLETWPRFDMHSVNSIEAETAIVLSR
jgi:site-specific DNA-methyltransferase (cytosine-N4-specific)